jgi:hypothetical protein
MEPIVTEMSGAQLFDVLMARNHKICQIERIKFKIKNLETLKAPKRTIKDDQCNWCRVKPFCVTMNAFDKVFKSQKEKISFFIEIEKKNKAKLKQISGLAEYNNLMITEKRKSGFMDGRMSIEYEEDSFDKKDSSFEKKVTMTDTKEMEDLMADFMMEEEKAIEENSQTIVNTLKMPDLEDLISDEEPNFYGLENIFALLSLEKVKYFAKWMDLIIQE